MAGLRQITKRGNGERLGRGCSYKEFLACNPKEYDGKGGVVVLTHWIEKMESMYNMSGCSIDQKVKYTAGSFVSKALMCHEMQKLESELWNHAMVGADHVAYTDRFHELARLVPHLVTPESRIIERNGSIKKVEKRGNVGEPSKDKNGKDDNKRSISPSDLGFKYEIEIARGQLAEIDKVIRGYKLEIEGHVFDIDLIPFGMGERPEEKARFLMGVKKQEEIVVVRDFPKVFPDDLTGLPPIQEIEFRFDLIPWSNLNILFLGHVINGNGIHVNPSKIKAVKNWKAPRTPTKKLRLTNGGEEQELTLDRTRLYVNAKRILAAQNEAMDEFAGLQKGLDEMIEQRSDGTMYYLNRIWVHLKDEVRTLIKDEAHKSKYSVHPGADKMYYDLRDMYWWPGIKKDIAEYVSKFLTCLKVKAEHQRPSSLLQQPKIPV
ncbi:putative reverse transcriptase domain-containing protein [Tanacetum coccineum]